MPLKQDPDIAVEQAPPALAALVNQTNQLLASLSALSDFLSGAKDAGVGNAPLNLPGAQASAVLAVDALNDRARALDEAASSLQEVSKDVAAMTDDQMQISATVSDVLRSIDEQALRTRSPNDVPPMANLQALSEQLDAVRTQLAGESAALDSRREELAAPLPRTNVEDALADRAMLRDDLATQQPLVDSMAAVVDAAKNLVAELRDVEIISLNFSVGEPNPLERAPAADVMEQRVAQIDPAYQWVHALGRLLGGEDADNNLVAANGSQNYRMLHLEQGIRAAANVPGSNIRVDIAATRVAENREGFSLEYRVHVGDEHQPRATARFDLTLEAPLSPESYGKVRAATKQLKQDLGAKLSPEQALQRLAEGVGHEQAKLDAEHLRKILEREQMKSEVERERDLTPFKGSDDLSREKLT